MITVCCDSIILCLCVYRCVRYMCVCVCLGSLCNFQRLGQQVEALNLFPMAIDLILYISFVIGHC